MTTPLWCDKSFCEHPNLTKAPVDSSKDGRSLWSPDPSLWSPDPTTIIIIYTQNGVLIIPPVKTQGHWEKKLKFQTAQKIW